MPWGLNQQINQFHVANAVTGVALCLCLLSLLIEAKKTTSILSIHEQLDHGCLRSGDLGSDSDFLLHDLEPLFVHLLNGHSSLYALWGTLVIFDADNNLVIFDAEDLVLIW